MYASASILLAGALLTLACDHETAPTVAPVSDCPVGERRVTFRLDGGEEVTRCVVFDTLIAGGTPQCALAIWTAPRNQRHDEGFRFETDPSDSTSSCNGNFFFGVTQNSAGGYTYFDGIVLRPFGSGAGPFATGTYQVINYQQVMVRIGHFEFWE